MSLSRHPGEDHPFTSPGGGTSTGSDPIALCLSGHISAPVMLARMVLAGATSGAVRQALAARTEAAGLVALLDSHITEIDRMHIMLARVDHASGADITRIAAQFDAAVTVAPEASVATYSLGNAALLDQATDEVVHWLSGQHLFTAGMDVLDLGCGIGRVAAALAPHAGSVLALDVAPNMIAEARRRHGHIGNLTCAVTTGDGLGFLPPASRDLVLAVDCFPYLFQAGVAKVHIMDVARVLRPYGRLAILNLSYAAHPAADRARAVAWANDAGLRLEQDGVSPFSLWDGAAFVFRRE